VGHGLEADFNRKGTSNYTNKIGERVASDLCTVVDDATLINSRGTICVDDEGNTPEKAVLIEGGVLAGYMHDQHSAKHFATKPTGNGRRESFQSHPMPRMTNTLLLAGPHGADEIVRSVKKGIYAKKFGGGQVDISNGDFVFSLTESYLIEDGKITAPLKGVNLIGNGPDVMCKVSMLGNDLETSDGIWTCGKDGQSVPVGVGCPTIKIASMTVGGTQLGRGLLIRPALSEYLRYKARTAWQTTTFKSSFSSALKSSSARAAPALTWLRPQFPRARTSR